MKLQSIKKGFTLIELLVVITIIGILATGATTVFTSQIQKARDTNRISDINALKNGVEQVYQDNSEYPKADEFLRWDSSQGVTWVLAYVEKIPADPKHGQPCNDGWVTANAPDCGYAYITWPDNNGIEYGEYEMSIAFENQGNTAVKWGQDGGWTGVELSRFELGIDISNNSTAVAKDAITTAGNGACTLAGAASSAWTTLIVLNGNPDWATNECN